MKRKTIVFSIFLMLVISTLTVSGIAINKNKINILSKDSTDKNFKDQMPDAKLPTWYIGNTWVYDGSIEGKQGTTISFDLDFTDMTLEVTAINPTNYAVDINVGEGDVTGFGRVDLDVLPPISGNLKDTEIYGSFNVNKSNLAIDRFDVGISGTVDALIDIDFSADISTLFFSGITFERMQYNTLDFPINVTDTWTREETYVISNLSVSLLPDPTNLYFNIPETLFSCESWDIVDVSGQDYDALKIKRNSEDNYIYYSPRAGNIIKVDFSNIDLGYGYILNNFDMKLKSTTYQVSSNPPETPLLPTGLTSLDVGTTTDYFTTTTDPDGDKIRYVFDFSDGTTITSDFIDSGSDGVISKTWDKKGNYELKVKARDKWGAESAYSDPLAIEVLNDAPEKPETPTGPPSGRIKKQSYTYETSTTDPNGHKVRFEFDWGDGSSSFTDYVNSGATATATNTWYRQGDFQIKVRAEDEYGEQSEWSDPLVVSMPKSKNINLHRFPILQRILHKFLPIFEKISTLL